MSSNTQQKPKQDKKPQKQKPKSMAKTTQKAKLKSKSKAPKEFKDFIFRQVKPSRMLGSGGVLRKTKRLGRLMRWPKYVKLQRQKKILLQRLKKPPAINIFSETCGKPFARNLVQLFLKYSPETKKQKKLRFASYAKLKAEGKPLPSEKPIRVRFGFNTVTNLIESGKAKLVLIAHDVDPIELVIWMPTLCAKKNVPFVIMKSKSRLGTIVHKKTASCLALCDVTPADKTDFDNLSNQARYQFNDRLTELRKRWGSRVLGIKTRHRIEKRMRMRQEEADKRKKAQAKKEEKPSKTEGGKKKKAKK